MRVEFFSDTQRLDQRFTELVSRADEIEIAVAWAGTPDDGPLDLLWKMRKKVKRLVVGCSLHNTNPAFLKRWQREAGFKVVTDTSEVFHPKLYLFRCRTETHLMIGSSNLTTGGFEKNREANVLLRGREVGPLSQAACYIEECHRTATPPGGKAWEQWLDRYSTEWRKRRNFDRSQQPRLRTGPGGKTGGGLADWSFDEYFARLKAGNRASNLPLSRWIELLALVRKRWSLAGWSIGQMKKKEDRQLLASTLKSPVDSRLFGTMGLGHFRGAVLTHPAKIDRAMNCIPRTGPVEDRHWKEFSLAYSNAFEKAATGTASRLLCFWRPDVFFTANSGSVPEIATQFGIAQSTLRTWDGYWMAAKWISERPWARSPKPQGTLAESVWQGRAALLDVLMYREP